MHVQRVACAVDTDPDGNCCLVAALAFDQNAGDFGALQHEIVGPFDCHSRFEPGSKRDDCVMGSKGGHQRQFRPMLDGRRSGQQQASVEVAGLRYPYAATAAAAGCLLRGDDPERTALMLPRTTQSFCVGRAYHVVCNNPHARCACPRISHHSGTASGCSKQRLRRRACGFDQRSGVDEEQEVEQPGDG